MKFWEENGRVNGRGSVGSTHSAIHLENPELHLRWYFKHFLGKAHNNYCGKTNDKSIFVLSTSKSDDQYRVILWTKTGIQRIYLPIESKTRTANSFCQEFSDLNVYRAPKEIDDPKIQEDLLYIEEQEGAINFKFGVLYRKKGQCTDNEILSNNNPSQEYRNFLKLIGEEVQLCGFEGFKGGLDVKGDTTGTHSYRTMMEGKQIMFHVSTMLPFTKDNPQQVERKRHIGNDIVNIVFQDDADDEFDFDPCWIKSQMTHMYALISFKKETNSYIFRIFNEEAVPYYGPEITNEYSDHEHFRRVLLVKLMNAEKAVYETPAFVARRERTIEQLLKEVYQRYVRHDDHDDHLRPFTELTDKIIETTPRIGRKKRIRKAAIFQEKGQDLKFKKIIDGHAPTSMNTTANSLQKKYAQQHYSNWKHDRIISDFSKRITCADFWDTYMLLGTDDGLSLIDSETSDISEIYDHSFLPKQITVVEDKSIAIVRAEKGKHKTGFMYIFDLAALTMKSQSSKNFKRKMKQERVHESKGCSLLCHYVSEDRLYIAVAKHKSVQLYEWRKVVGQGQGWFVLKDEFQITDVQSISIFTRASGMKICVGTSSEFLIIDADAIENDKKKCIERLQKHKENTSLCITPVIKNVKEETEKMKTNWALGVLLTYNNISCLEQFTLHPDNMFTALIKWHIKPSHIHCALPYFIALGQQGIEIRLANNGNIVHSIEVHGLSYLSCRSHLLYFAIWDSNKGLSDVSSLPTSVNLGSTSTISSNLAMSNESVEHDNTITILTGPQLAPQTQSSLTREGLLSRSFNESRTRAYTTSQQPVLKTPVPNRASLYRSTTPKNRRSFNGNYLHANDSYDHMKHSFSTIDLAYDSDSIENDLSPASFSSGYDLHYDVFDSPNASLFRVVSVEFNNNNVNNSRRKSDSENYNY